MQIRATGHGVEVTGVSERQLRDALDTTKVLEELASRLSMPRDRVRQVMAALVEAKWHQIEQAPSRRRQLLEALMADPRVLDPVPYASLDQMRRVAQTRNHLLASGAYTIASLARSLGKKPDAVRAWLTRMRKAHKLFTIALRGEAYVPAFLLDEAGDPYPRLAATIKQLRDAGLDEWALWVWFDSASPWLGGDRPVDLVREGAFDRLAAAARDQGSNVAA